jgi:hypothetical protein
MHGDGDPVGSPTNGDHDVLDPGSAAALLEQTSKQARRQFDVRPPLLMLFGAVLVLFCYGDIWLSVRGQHPYTGPSHTALAVLYATLFAGIIVFVVIRGRARRGIGGRSSRQQRTAGVVFATIYLLVYVFAGALDHAGAGKAIVYGIYPAAAPLIIMGGAAAIYELAQEHRGWATFALAVAVLAALAAYAGPNNVWGVIGVGFSVLLLLRAASQIWNWQRPAWARRPGWARTYVH